MSITITNSKVSYGSSIVTDGLVGYWDAANPDSYPGSGTIWYDLSDNRLNATMEDSSSYNLNGYMRLNGTTDAFQFGSNDLFESQTITVSAWINLDDRGDRHILLTNWYGWSFEIHADRRPYFRLYSVSPGDLYSTEYIEWGKWCQIVATYNGAGNTRVIALNGNVNNSVVTTGPIPYNTIFNFNIPYTNNPAYGLGKIACIKIYNKALSSSEILQNYNAQKSRFGL